MTNTVLTVCGRQVGERGRRTRLLLLELLADELATTGYREASIVEIARRANTSAATFYQYFPDIDQAILTLAEDIAHEGSDNASTSRQPAPRELVQEFFALYERHRAVLRVIDMKSSEGDQRFTTLRIRFLDGLRCDLERAARAANPSATERVITSAVATMVLTVTQAAAHGADLAAWSLDAATVQTSTAQLLHTALTHLVP
ncbi:TetR family transcriptional regulator [Streptomyces lydicus]|uniref:TetR family transcriptional regulator n=1 Tax=Streptomyces lydicus TaxID=47763 RepID=UPI0013E8FF02|nr:TetR family transcriptional regulator [Streptomyces lydicus]MCZ1012317.1 TetR family transcriptional regulator [Streptomyces lydicus]